MRRPQFEHVIAAAAIVSGEREIVVVGSQAILGNVDEPPESMLFSMEVDVYPRHDPEKAGDIDGSLGDGSQFQSTYGYYAHGVGPETAKAPAGWEERLVKIDIPPRPGQSEEPSPSAWRSTTWCLPSVSRVAIAIGSSRATRWQRVWLRSRSLSGARRTFRYPHLKGSAYGKCSPAS